MVQLVWFKRDLRIRDHEPLARAARAGKILALYVYEPTLWQQPEHSAAQWSCVADGLRHLRQSLQSLGGQLVLREGDICQVLDAIHSEVGIDRIWAHEETGIYWTFQRDIAVGQWAAAQSVDFEELPQFGVFRRLRSRDGWAKRWHRRLSETPTPLPSEISWQTLPVVPSIEQRLDDTPPFAWAISEAAALETWQQFRDRRDNHYPRDISSPLTAESTCSRLSWHLAYGTISMRQLYQQAYTRAQREPTMGPQPMQGFIERLSWHCHFIQKLESEPALEFRNANRDYDTLRISQDKWREQQQKMFTAWAQGQTGVPIVDAAMRYLQHHKWINFRMRAMLVSFACYHLWLDWKPVATHLAQLFADSEPGIHFSQVQMQAGTFGMNQNRIYRPAKQQREQDPDAEFVKLWVPALNGLSSESILAHYDSRAALGDYPAPIVPLAQAYKRANQRMKQFNRLVASPQRRQAVYDKHGSRRGRWRKR